MQYCIPFILKNLPLSHGKMSMVDQEVILEVNMRASEAHSENLVPYLIDRYRVIHNNNCLLKIAL